MSFEFSYIWWESKLETSERQIVSNLCKLWNHSCLSLIIKTIQLKKDPLGRNSLVSVPISYNQFIALETLLLQTLKEEAAPLAVLSAPSGSSPCRALAHSKTACGHTKKPAAAKKKPSAVTNSRRELVLWSEWTLSSRSMTGSPRDTSPRAVEGTMTLTGGCVHK